MEKKKLLLKEKLKYENVYEKEEYNKNKDWKKRKNKKSIDDILKLKPLSIIDVGCGRNGLKKEILNQSNIKKFIGVDIAAKEADIISSADNIPCKNNEFDLLVSLDVLEHIPESLIEDTLKEWARVSKRFYLKIAMFEEHHSLSGEHLHLCVKKHDWWEKKLKKYTEVIKKELITGTLGKFDSYSHVIFFCEKKENIDL